MARLRGSHTSGAHSRNGSEQCAQCESGPGAAELPEAIGIQSNITIQLTPLYTICLHLSIIFLPGVI
jgi:hypothetical protein